MIEVTMCFVNVFILPIISLYVYLKRGSKEISFTFDNVCKYAVFLSLGIVCNKAVIATIRTLLAIQISMSSGQYTVIGVLTSIFLPMIFEIINKYFSIRIEAENGKK